MPYTHTPHARLTSRPHIRMVVPNVIAERLLPGPVMRPREVEDTIDPGHCAGQLCLVLQRSPDELDPTGQIAERPAVPARQDADVMTLFDQTAGQVTPDKAGAPDDHHAGRAHPSQRKQDAPLKRGQGGRAVFQRLHDFQRLFRRSACQAPATDAGVKGGNGIAKAQSVWVSRLKDRPWRQPSSRPRAEGRQPC